MYTFTRPVVIENIEIATSFVIASTKEYEKDCVTVRCWRNTVIVATNVKNTRHGTFLYVMPYHDLKFNFYKRLIMVKVIVMEKLRDESNSQIWYTVSVFKNMKKKQGENE